MSTQLLVPLDDTVVFPNMSVTLTVDVGDAERVLLVPRHDGEFAEVGTVAEVTGKVRLPGGGRAVELQGLHRGVAGAAGTDLNGRLVVEVEEVEDDEPVDGRTRNLEREYRAVVEEILELRGDDGRISQFLRSISEPGTLADTSGYSPDLSFDQKVELLVTLDVTDRLELALKLQRERLAELQVRRRIREDVQDGAEKQQREYFLRKQMDSIRKELGEDDGSVIDEYRKKIEDADMPEAVREQADKELARLERMGEQSGESSMIRTYLDWIVDLPWGKKSKVKKDIRAAQAVLDADHFGLEKVKDRIVEYLAVQARTNKLKGPILCLVGPPGVGKTSLGRSIARATGREFVRQSLGGVRDEAEIRGHRRTYIGSLPGKIVSNLKKAGTSNPLFLLDEIDKLGQDFRGDPASALLEVLDPEQNSKFQDHYLELDYDLSDVMFVTTANSLDMPQPLLDRMEIIRLEGYTEDEKVEIARRHLIPKQMEAHGLKDKEVEFSDEALRGILRFYTREAGVRTLERELAKIARKALRQILEGKYESVVVNDANLNDFLGVRRYRYGVGEEEDQVGAVTGLAWTEVGGELLTIEAVTVPGKGQIKTTGKLGEVMQESIQAAMSFVKARAPAYGVKPSIFARKDIHVHLPEGAVPKDGPSAGIGMVTAMISTLTGIPVRRDVAMTGEVTLRGRVLPIGGLKEKLLAALRGGITTVLIPQENEKDLVDIPASLKAQIEIVPVEHVDEVLARAMTQPMQPIEWTDADEHAAEPPLAGHSSEGETPLRH